MLVHEFLLRRRERAELVGDRVVVRVLPAAVIVLQSVLDPLEVVLKLAVCLRGRRGPWGAAGGRVITPELVFVGQD